MYKNNNIKKIRTEKKVTQQQLADYLGLTMQAVAQYEKGLRTPSLLTLYKISEFLNVSFEEITGEQLTNTQIFLRETLKDRNISLEDLAKDINVPVSELEALYNNDLGVTKQTVLKFFKSIGISNIDRIAEILKSDAEINVLCNNKSTPYFFGDATYTIDSIIKNPEQLKNFKNTIITSQLEKTLKKQEERKIIEIDVSDLEDKEIEDIKKYVEFIKFNKKNK